MPSFVFLFMLISPVMNFLSMLYIIDGKSTYRVSIMPSVTLHLVLLWIQHSISFCGVLVIFFGVLLALSRYAIYLFSRDNVTDINQIRLKLGQVLTLGLEFIVAADLIGTTTAPDYYTVGILASIVLIRTLLSYTLNREINTISQQEKQRQPLDNLPSGPA